MFQYILICYSDMFTIHFNGAERYGNICLLVIPYAVDYGIFLLVIGNVMCYIMLYF